MTIPFKKVERLKRRSLGYPQVTKSNDQLSNDNHLVTRQGQYSDCWIIYAKKLHRITEEEIKAIKNDLLTPKGLLMGKLNKIYKITLLFNLNRILTLKGILVRMGKGKGKIKTKAQYLTTGTRCIILNKITTEPINKNLIVKLINKFISKYSYFSYKNSV